MVPDELSVDPMAYKLARDLPDASPAYCPMLFKRHPVHTFASENELV
jgi:hypothetical protein